MTTISLGNGICCTASQFPAAFLDPCGGGFQGKSYETVLVVGPRYPGQGSDLGIRQLAREQQEQLRTPIKIEAIPV